MERCPNCRARIKEQPQQCRRCSMELDTLWELKEKVMMLDKKAAKAILEGKMKQAKQLLKQRIKLINDAFIQELLLFVSTQADKENLSDAKLIQLNANQWESFQNLLGRSSFNPLRIGDTGDQA